MSLLETLSKSLLDDFTEENCSKLLSYCRAKGFFAIGIILGKYFSEIWKHNINIRDEYAMCYYYLGDREFAFSIYESITKDFPNLSEENLKAFSFNSHFTLVESVKNKYTYYNKDKIREMMARELPAFPRVTFTITTCKRYDLFEKTINSFINCCEDLHMIDSWLCIDDNSSQEDRLKMQKKYPFFRFYFKGKELKGHAQSMNIIWKQVKTPYLFHIEDDWQFFKKRPYISHCLSVLGESETYGQCLINKNYAETGDDFDIIGGEFKRTPSGIGYFIHDHYPNEKMHEFIQKHGIGKNCAYWPHFSFRPSLLKMNALKIVGKFNPQASHFEMEYAHRWVKNGFGSTFLEGINSLHIGRLTSERHDQTKLNAYQLNNEAQFTGKPAVVEEPKVKKRINTWVINLEPKKSNPEPKLAVIEEVEDISDYIQLKTWIVNLERRPDRWEKFEKEIEDRLNFLKCERYYAVDGKLLDKNSIQLQRLFNENDYNWRVGLVGCALSHIKLWIELLKDECEAYLILEDDAEILPNFEHRLCNIAHEADYKDWDVIFLGHHIYEKYVDSSTFNSNNTVRCEKWNRIISLTKSRGGTFGYLVSKRGAQGLLNFINNRGMTNGIDTMMQKAADDLNVYYTSPHLVKSECFTGQNYNNLDTDIQFDHTSLAVDLETRERQEKEYYTERGYTINISKFPSLDDTSVLFRHFISSSECSKYLRNNTEIGYYEYFIGDKILVVVPAQIAVEVAEDRYCFSRLKKYDKESKTESWSVSSIK
uniref:Glycosyltransferase family 25 LPS biosynthesis protein n=1 Tax=Iridovirus LCIVAC01 TaxID=2506607 RepID=A0A481YRG7_9VIRU|nr:MAG: glycosyltransferase family 25 LPS biosynthesis protein [Iridovirus LCIVAC01]